MAISTFIRSRRFRIGAVLILILIIVGVTFGMFEFFKKAPDLSKVKPDFTLTSEELYAAFEKDEKAANDKYSMKVIEVTGKVAEINYGSVDSTLSIILRPDDQFSGVICTLSGIKDLSQVSIKNGEMVCLRGECSGMLMDVLLNNCVLMKNTE